MNRNIIPRTRLVAIVLFVVLICLILVTGVGLTSGETDTHITLNHTGEVGPIFPEDESHNISNVDIDTSPNDDDAYEYISVYVGFSDLENKGANYSNVDVASIQISGGELKQVSRENTSDNTVIRLKIQQYDSEKNIRLQNIEFKGLNTTSLEGPSKVRYNLAVAEFDSDTTFSDLKSEDRVSGSKKFRLIGATLTVPDQATGSSQLLSDELTDTGVSIKNFTSNTNATIVITRDNDDEIVTGYKSYSSDPDQVTSIHTDFLGGKINVYSVPTAHVDHNELNIGDPVPETIFNSSMTGDSAHILWSSVEFEDVTYNSSTNNISVESANLQDMVDDDTEYVLSLHPLSTSGNLISNTTLAHSKVLTGNNDNIPLNATQGSNQQITFSHSNRFAVAVRLVNEEVGSETDLLEVSSILPNSDLNEQFVPNGVSDGGHVIIDPKFDPETSNVSRYAYNSSAVEQRVYAGEPISYNTSNEDFDNVEMHRIKEDTATVTAVGNPVEGTDYVLFNTTKMDGGNYTFSDSSSRISTEFQLLSEGEQEVSMKMKNVSRKTGSSFNTTVHHNTRNMNLSLKDNQSTAATIELATPTDDAIPLTFNTYAAGDQSLAEDLVTIGANATVESVETSTPNGTLAPGSYTLSARSEYGSVTTSANTTIDIEARETRSLTAYTTSALDPNELQSTGDIDAAIADGTLSPSTTVSDTETVVYAVDASGLDGAPAARTADLDTGADVAAFDGFAFGVRSTETDSESGSDSTTQVSTSDDDELGSIPANATAHVDDEGLYLVAAGDAALATEDSPDDGDEFTATFRVDDERLRASAPSDDEHAVNTTMTYTAPDRDDSDGTDAGSTGGADSGGDDGGDGGGGGGAGGGESSSGSLSDGAGGDISGQDDSLDTPETPETQAGEAASGPGVEDISTGRLAPRLPIGAYAFADLRAAYRDRPDGVSTPTGTEWQSEAAGAGEGTDNGSATTRTDPSDAADSEASADRRDSERSTATPDSPGYDNAPIRSTAYDVPGFGPVVTLVALAAASLLARRRP